jgi:hypothetical protein
VMSISQQPTVALTRAQRDAVHDAVELICGRDELSHFDPDRREDITSLIGHLSAVPRLLEQIGWERGGDRETYELDIDDDIANLMQEVGRTGIAVLTDAYRSGDMRAVDVDVAKVAAAGIVEGPRREAMATAIITRER